MIIKVMHIITDLGLGGAETMLYRLLSKIDSVRFKNEVISMTDLGGNAENIRAAGVPVRALGMKRGIPNPFPAVRLHRWIRESKPHVVQTWMYHANFIGGLTARFAGDIPVVWSIHQVDLNPQLTKLLTIWTAKVCARISRWLPGCVVFVSQASFFSHAKLGYVANRMEVIPNGFDVEQYKPDPVARMSVREELGISAETPLIGLAAHFRPMKDHRNFVHAAARLHTQMPKVHFLLCGDGITWQNSQLAGWIKAAGIHDFCHLLGPRHDMPRLFGGMDIAATSSAGNEAFPLVIGEAMACGIPCVVTDVGDSALIVGETGRVVAPRNPDALAEAWRELIQAGPAIRHQLGATARLRVQQRFALPAIARRYEEIYSELADKFQQRMPSGDLAHTLSRA